MAAKISLTFLTFILVLPSLSLGKELSKVAIWDLTALGIPSEYAKQLTEILGSEIDKFGKYEVYSQENVRTLAGWEAQKMQLGCTDTRCLTALGQMDIAKLISGSVGKIGGTYTVSLSLFDTRSVRAERKISEFCSLENELIGLVQQAGRKLLGVVEVDPVPTVAAKKEPKPKEGWIDPVTGMEFIFVKGDCFEMGDIFGDGREDERPVHEVCLDDFYIGKYEVTQGQWEKVMGNLSSFYRRADTAHPIIVSWNHAQWFIDRLNSQNGHRYRLPTEAEWEYASRSGGKKEKFSGTSREEELGIYAWYRGSMVNVGNHSVGQKKPNGLGLYDMSGNAKEWCADWYDGNYYKNSPKYNPPGPNDGNYRVLRGGSWELDAAYVRTTARDWADPAAASVFKLFGFRLAVSTR